MQSKRSLRPMALACALIGAVTSGTAQEIVPSGFATVGFAASNRPFAFERFINDKGTFQRDSIIGLQIDARLNTHWSATIQLTAAPAQDSDDRWQARTAWAFVGFRPANDWVVRGGRFRVPLYMQSEQLNVGVTHDMARLPTEMYSISPTNDVDGISAGRAWGDSHSEWSLDVYRGEATTTTRLWLSAGLPPTQSAGAGFMDFKVRSTGVVATVRLATGQWRASWHRTSSGSDRPLAVTFPYVPGPGGVGYYQVDPAMPGPGVPTVSRVRNDLFTLGVERMLPGGWRIAAEFARNRQLDTELGAETRGGYVALFRTLGDYTPYLSVGALRSGGSQIDWIERLQTTRVPSFVPGAGQINAAQQLASETAVYVADQNSLAVGGSLVVAPGQKMKVEWKRTWIGRVSRFVDSPIGENVRNKSVDIWSVNYNAAF